MQEGCNAFHLCAAGGHVAVAEYLVPKMKGHLFDLDDNGYTALHVAASFGQLSMVEYLVRSCGFDVKARDKVDPNDIRTCVYSTLYAFVYSKSFERVSSSVSFQNCYGMMFCMDSLFCQFYP